VKQVYYLTGIFKTRYSKKCVDRRKRLYIRKLKLKLKWGEKLPTMGRGGIHYNIMVTEVTNVKWMTLNQDQSSVWLLH
jgi:hypothetical protein